MLASYLAVWFAVCAIPIGASGVLFTSYLVRGGWTPDLHAPLSNAALTMPFAAVLFIPVLVGLSCDLSLGGGRRQPSRLQGSLSDALVLRAARHSLFRDLDCARCLGGARLWQRRGDDTRGLGRADRLGAHRRHGPASTGWKSVEPHFHSSIYGLFAISFDLLGRRSPSAWSRC